MTDPDFAGTAGSDGRSARLLGLARTVIRTWAILGGFVLIALVLMTASSVVSGYMFGKPFPGDFELVELGVAVAAFSFLPYCQLTGANVTVDIFTAWAPARLIDSFQLIASVIAAAFAVLLLTTMYDGMAYYQKYNEVTPILEVPIWSVFPPILISLALLAVAAAITFVEALRAVARPASQ